LKKKVEKGDLEEYRWELEKKNTDLDNLIKNSSKVKHSIELKQKFLLKHINQTNYAELGDYYSQAILTRDLKL